MATVAHERKDSLLFDNKIIFLDIDGTLIHGEKQTIPDSAILAIRQARSNGHRVYLNTGHAKAQIYPELWQIGLDGLVGGNGCYIEDQGQTVLHRTLTLDECKRAVEWMRAHQFEFFLETNVGTFASEGLIELLVKVFPWDPDTNRKLIHKIFVGLVEHGELIRSDVNKISFYMNSFITHQNSADAQLAKADFSDLHVGTWAFPNYPDMWCELAQNGIDKGTAIPILVQHLGAKMENTLAFGDSEVDIPMLRQAAIGVAMGNAKPEVKLVADYVTKNANEDGIAHAFKHFDLI